MKSPLAVILASVSAPLPVFVRVTGCAELVVPTGRLPNARLAGERLTTGAVLVPVPERLTVWGLPLALSATLSAAVRAPLAEGVNVTLIVQLAPATTELLQLLV